MSSYLSSQKKKKSAKNWAGYLSIQWGQCPWDVLSSSQFSVLTFYVKEKKNSSYRPVIQLGSIIVYILKEYIYIFLTGMVEILKEIFEFPRLIFAPQVCKFQDSSIIVYVHSLPIFFFILLPKSVRLISLYILFIFSFYHLEPWK